MAGFNDAGGEMRGAESGASSVEGVALNHDGSFQVPIS